MAKPKKSTLSRKDRELLLNTNLTNRNSSQSVAQMLLTVMISFGAVGLTLTVSIPSLGYIFFIISFIAIFIYFFFYMKELQKVDLFEKQYLRHYYKLFPKGKYPELKDDHLVT